MIWDASRMVKDLLGVPTEMEPYDMMVIGYPALHPSEKFLRDPKKMVHYDDCGREDFRDENGAKDFVERTRNWTIGTHSRKAE